MPVAVTTTRGDRESDTSSTSSLALLGVVLMTASVGGAMHWRSAGLASCAALVGGGLAGVYAAEQRCSGIIRASVVASGDAVGQLLGCPSFQTDTLTTITTVERDSRTAVSIRAGWQFQQRVCGRPFFGANHSAPIVAAARSQSKSPQSVRAARWTEQALGEHASVASFAAFSLQLMLNGAAAN